MKPRSGSAIPGHERFGGHELSSALRARIWRYPEVEWTMHGGVLWCQNRLHQPAMLRSDDICGRLYDWLPTCPSPPRVAPAACISPDCLPIYNVQKRGVSHNACWLRDARPSSDSLAYALWHLTRAPRSFDDNSRDTSLRLTRGNA